MRKYFIICVAFIVFVIQKGMAQSQPKWDAVAIYNQIERLDFLGSVLYVAAHPDDENTRMISYFSNQMKARTGYLSLTRGDGGQNLIGKELRELLGVIRTQELLEARKIDGGEQFFTRANDFGFSKNPTETFEIWNKEAILSDVVYAIRKFRPDVIISRFDHRTAGNTHGHHSASALLSLEAFGKAGDKKNYPEQLTSVLPWQAKRQFFNTSWWFYGSQEKFMAANKLQFLPLNMGVYYASLGKSNQEIAALSRSCHQSQGFGTSGTRGDDIEYLEPINGTDLPKKDVFEGIDTSWNRVEGGKAIAVLLTKVKANFDFKKPESSIPDLLKTYTLIQEIKDTHWKTIKTNEIKDIIAACAGLYLEAVTSKQEVVPGEVLKLKVEAVNRSTVEIILKSLVVLPENKVFTQNLNLKTNNNQASSIELQLPNNQDYTSPFWLKSPGQIGLYQVDNQDLRIQADVQSEAKVVFKIDFNGVEIDFERTIVYKNNDVVKGEMCSFVDVVPLVSTTILDKVALFTSAEARKIGVKISAGINNCKGIVQLKLPSSWKVEPKNFSFDLEKKGDSQTAYFSVKPPHNNQEVVAQCSAMIAGQEHNLEQIIIDFNHIGKQQVLKQSEAKFIKTDLKINNEKIAYIMGAGDEVPKSLMQMGYAVTMLTPQEITPELLANFDVVVTGIRAYNTLPELANKQKILFEFVKSGKTMLVQYNTPNNLVTKDIAPFMLKISGDRVTNENAQVQFLNTNHRVLNVPNKITTADFEGWKQEQGLYYPSEFDTVFEPILSSNDKDETPKKGALLVANYGKGYFIYTGLSFFRELPEGVTGAYRLMANLISLKN